VLTKDKRIRFNELEKGAILRNHVREFYFSSGNSSGTEMAEILITALPGMFKLFREHEPPFVASITRSGAVNLRLE